MRILYGVVGEGMGHAMRSSVLLDRLAAKGHEVRIVVSGRAAEYLDKRHPGKVTRITGLTMVYEDNTVQKIKTAFANLKAIADVPDNMRAYLEMARSFSPDVVISDFESWSYWFAKGQRIPIISVDNMQIMPRCHHESDVLGDEMRSFLLAKSIVRAKLPRCNAYLITTFFYPRIKRDRTTLHPPILRNVILDAKAQTKNGEHVLVYQSGTSHDTLLDVLKSVGAPFRIYGMKRGITAEEKDGNIVHCPFSETKFIDDIATARAVISGGGFTLMGEAIYLGKPMLSVPLVGQFEQVLNANYLEKLGYGERAHEITKDGLARFLARAPEYARNLQRFEHDRNDGLFDQLERSMAEAIAEGARGVEP
jgi:uncharacterized protein (TIGR00661 family)